jgi:hypothetical protein
MKKGKKIRNLLFSLFDVTRKSKEMQHDFLYALKNIKYNENNNKTQENVTVIINNCISKKYFHVKAIFINFVQYV